MVPKKPVSDWAPEVSGMMLLLHSTKALYTCRDTLPEKTFEKVLSFAKLLIGKTERLKEARPVPTVRLGSRQSH